MSEPEFQLGPRGGLLTKTEEGKGPAPSAPSAPPAGEPGEITLGPRGGITEQQQQGPSAPDFATDIGKSALAGFGRGAVGLTGLPGDVESLIDLAREKISGKKPGERYFPNSEEMIQKAEALHPSIKETLSYQPQTVHGRFARSGAEFIPGALAGPGGLGTKVAGGLAAGLATQGVEEASQNLGLGPGAEAALKIGASIPAYMLGAKGASTIGKVTEGALMPKSAATEDLAKAALSDLRTAGKYGAPEGAREALLAGQELTPGAVAGSQTKAILQNAASKLPVEELEAYTQRAAKAAENAPKNTMRHIDDMFGRELKLSDELDDVARRIRETNEPNYQRVMSMPELQSIGGPEYDALMSRVPQSIKNKIFKDMQIAGLSPQEMGLINTPAGLAINPQGMPLRFWDEMKKGIDSQISGLKDITGKVTDTSRYSALNSLAGDLRTQLNKIEPYKQIRNEAAELFGVRDWTQLGEKYLTMGSGNMQKIRQIESRLAQASPERQMDFATGLAASYKDMLENNADKALAMFKGRDGQFQMQKFVNALAPLGQDAGYNLIGKVNAEMLNRNIAALRSPTKTEAIKSQYLPFVGGAAGGLADLLMQPFIWSGSPTAIATAMAGYGLTKLYTMKEIRRAREVLELASDPAMGAELGRLLAKDANARSFMTKTNDILSKNVKYAAGADIGMEPPKQDQQPAQVSKQKASGGRVGRATGGRTAPIMTAERLMRAAHAAKLKINKTTEPLLDQPDEAVVKALSVAQQHI